MLRKHIIARQRRPWRGQVRLLAALQGTAEDEGGAWHSYEEAPHSERMLCNH